MSESTKIYLGMDEAGRGSVIGPLVMGSVSITKSTLEYYESTEITDSKKLSPKKREQLFDIIKETNFTSRTIALTSLDIDKAVLSRTSNLNILELQTMIKLIIENQLATDIFIDAISTPDYCTNNLKTLLKNDSSVLSVKKLSADTLSLSRMVDDHCVKATIIAQNKADINYKVVSAASILAKVTRDKAIRDLEIEFGLPIGILASGYPNNQLKPFLNKYKKQIKKKEFPFIRYSWDWLPLKSLISSNNLKQEKLL